MRIIDKERAQAQAAANLTELWVIGTAEDIAHLTATLRDAGTVIYESQPHVMRGNDPRIRIYLRLYLHNA